MPDRRPAVSPNNLAIAPGKGLPSLAGMAQRTAPSFMSPSPAAETTSSPASGRDRVSERRVYVSGAAALSGRPFPGHLPLIGPELISYLRSFKTPYRVRISTVRSMGKASLRCPSRPVTVVARSREL